MANSFDRLSTMTFQQRMHPKALAIYQRLFPGCAIQDLRENGVNVHVLDKEFGIDSLIVMHSGQWVSLQEKYRKNRYLVERQLQTKPPTPDFTQEIVNAKGTPYESPGEWFKLGAQLYFYGWANADETDFAKWVLIDIAKYKLIVENRGGIERLGKMKQNSAHGKAMFVAFPVTAIRDSWVSTYSTSDPLLVPYTEFEEAAICRREISRSGQRMLFA